VSFTPSSQARKRSRNRRAPRISFAPILRLKYLDLIDRESQVAVPKVGGKPGLLLEMRHELVRLRQLSPDLRQKGGAVSAVLNDDAVDAGTKAEQGIGLAAELERLRRGQDGNLDAHVGELVGRQRRKARVVESGCVGVARHVVEEGAMRFERANAATQLPVKGEGDEGSRRFIEPGRTRQDGPGRAEFRGDGSACQRGEKPPLGLMFSGQDEFLP
jgi:hypothetical protein